jgi:hypothetical protein
MSGVVPPVGELENSAITLANGIFTPHSVALGFSSISYKILRYDTDNADNITVAVLLQFL